MELSVKNIDEVLSFCIDIHNDINLIDNISFSDDFNIKVKVQGEKWNGAIDYRAAEYVLCLQREVFRIIKDVTGKNIYISSLQNYDYNLIVSIEVNEGCTEYIAKFKNFMDSIPKEVWKKVEGKHLLYGFIAWILCSSGVDVCKDYNERLVKIEQMHVQNNSIDALKDAIGALKTSIDVGKKNQEHLVYLAEKTSKNDKIEINDIPVNRDTIIEEYKKPKVVPEPQKYTIDDKYFIQKLDAENHKISIKNDNMRSRQVGTENLTDDEKKMIHSAISDSDITGTLSSLDMQITALICDGQIEKIVLDGIGDKREGSMTLQSAIKLSMENN